jgi:hypothetical protein
MWFSVGWRVVVSALWVALACALFYPLSEVASQLSDKVEGDDPSKLRQTLANRVAIFVGVLFALTGNAIMLSVLALVIWRRFRG